MTPAVEVPSHAPSRARLLARTLRWQIRTELASTLRAAEFVGGALAIPVILYAMFGLPVSRSLLPGGTPVGAMMAVSFSAYGIVSLAIFTFGDELAKERGRGWTRTLRATPLPEGVHLAGKATMAVAHSLLIVLAIGLVATVAGGVRLPPTTWLRLAAVLAGGVLAFSTIGFALAYLVRPRAASMIANLVFLPLSFCSGFFFPLQNLPRLLQEVAPWLPTYHYGQLAWRQVAPEGDVAAFVGLTPRPAAVHLAWVVGSFVVFGLVALTAARREAVARRA
ncbi:ABC transporter permease [Egicoccus sp. AB-alg6-2]|uniref:ABC transporter permease n=1 Tax=Egicoccus sp. AB-alg6-2 TaxID=3242692 RepID=UPI00359DFBDB